MKQPDWNIIIDYLTGEISGEDRNAFEKWLDEKPENRQYFDSVKKIWAADTNAMPPPDTEAALTEVLERIKIQGEEARVFRLSGTAKSKPDFIFVLASRFFKAAAVVFFVLGAFYFYRIITSEANNVKVSKSFSSIDTLILSDGSRVIADAGTHLEYLTRFPRLGTREIELAGEAYFEVTPNPKAPFRVMTKHGSVTVLGTKFNVSDWDNENKLTVAVLGGKVSLQGLHENKGSVVLTGGQISSVSADGAPLEPRDIDVNSILSWIEREMYFRNTALKDVINLMERWYDVKISIDNPELLEDRITVYIQNKPVEENLKVLCSIFNLHYIREGKTIKLISGRD